MNVGKWMGVLLIPGFVFAGGDDTVKLKIATQTYQCTITNQLNCTAVNNVEQKVFDLKKNQGKIQIADSSKGLSLDLVTENTNGQVLYDLTLCSQKVCTFNNVSGGPQGTINQSLFGQYNITEKSFFVIGIALNTNGVSANLEEQLLKHFAK